MNKTCVTRNAKPIYARVKAQESNGEVHFKVRWKTHKLWPFTNEGPIEQDVNTGAREIIFEIDDRTPYGLRFFDDAEDAFWVQPDRCPNGKCNSGGQTQILGVEDQGRVLRVLNANTEPAELHYALHMNGARTEQGPPYSYDPIIKNRGG